MSYDIVKALHVVSVIACMAGLLHLPRLYFYNAETAIGTLQAETLKVMERRLLKAIITPAIIASFLFGIWMLVLAPCLLCEPCIIIKILCVFGLAGCHDLFARMRRNLENDKMPYGPKAHKIWK